jgi:hypothetical protein
MRLRKVLSFDCGFAWPATETMAIITTANAAISFDARFMQNLVPVRRKRLF